MSRIDDLSTSLTLIHRLASASVDQSAWTDFVERYGDRLQEWLQGRGLQPSDAQDVVQNVLLDVSRQMRTFQYDSSKCFRNWLKTIAYRAWCDFLKRRQREARDTDSEVLRLLGSRTSCEEFTRHLELEHDRELLALATARVRGRVAELTWQAFERITLQQQPANLVAAQLNATPGTIRVYNSRVKHLLQQEIERLDQDPR